MIDGLADLPGALAAMGDTSADTFAPDRFLEGFSDRIQRLLPHDRVSLSHLDDDGRTFTIVAERAVRGPLLHRDHYTSDFAPDARHVVAEWGIRPAFAGEPMLVEDFAGDPRFAEVNQYERTLWEAGFHAGVFVPLRRGGRITGVLAVMSTDRPYDRAARLRPRPRGGHLPREPRPPAADPHDDLCLRGGHAAPAARERLRRQPRHRLRHLRRPDALAPAHAAGDAHRLLALDDAGLRWQPRTWIARLRPRPQVAAPGIQGASQ